MNSKVENVDLVAMSLRKPNILKSQRELFARVLSACVLAPFFVWITYVGGWIFYSALILVFIGALREWSRLATPSIFHPLCSLVLIVLAYYHFPDYAIYMQIFGILFLVISVFYQFKIIKLSSNQHWVFFISGLVYISLSMECFIQLRQQYGPFFVFWLYGIVWATDSGAYFIGRTLKGPKLCPGISPNKTWSGFIGGIITAMMVSIYTLKLFEVSFFTIVPTVFLVLFLSLAAHAGDLIESFAKRYFGVKNAGGLIPGHGGVIDRLDGLFLVIILTKIFILLNIIKFQTYPG